MPSIPRMSDAGSEGVFLFMLDVFVFECLPVGDEHGVRIVVRAYLEVTEVSLGDERARDGGTTPVDFLCAIIAEVAFRHINRSEEHTSELQSLMRLSYPV